MPQIPRTSPATGLPTPPSFVHTTAFSFVDTHGRTLLLRGVNLSGASKAPVGKLSHVLEDFWESAGAEEDVDCWFEDEEGGDGESVVVDDEEGGRGSDSESSRSASSSNGSRNGRGRERGKMSFVGRPLRLDDGSADVHLARLRGWGFNLLRFPFTWEALEHEGPGKYDYEFMDYTIQVLCKCKEYGFRVYMDPHQDTWSRFSGGSGAPFWTLPACGINPRHITATQAALLHCEYPSPYTPGGPTPASLPAMAWSTNYGRLLSQTVFTLFFAGRDFAPNCVIDGVNIQDYLQGHYIEACGQLVDRIRAYDDRLIAEGKCSRGEGLLDACVIGWDSMNEPFEGLCGWADLGVNPTEQGSTLKKGTYPTPAQSMRLGMGQKQTVEHWTFGTMGPARDGTVEVDPKGRKVWADALGIPPDSDVDLDSLEGVGVEGELPDGTHPRWGWRRDVSRWKLGTCVWALHGVWDVDTGFVLRPAYFATHPATGVEVEFLSDYWKPHWLAYAKRVRRSHPEAIVFVQPPVFAIPPQFSEEELQGRTAYAPHYYDGLTLVTRHWNWFNADALGLLRGKYSSALRAVKIGEGAIRRSLHEQLGYLQSDVASPSAPGGGGGALGGEEGRGYPTVIGEIGTPFDMDGKRAYGWTDGGRHRGDYRNQEKALDASLQACDAWMVLKGKEREREREGGGGGGGGGRGDSLNWTVWTYVPDDHSHEWGDGWNMEDLSLFSLDDLVLEEEDLCCCCCDEEEEQDNGERRERGAEAERQPGAGGSGGDVYNDMQDMRAMDQETLNSRAVLLMDGEREANALVNMVGAGAHACGCKSKCKRARLSRANSKANSKDDLKNATSKDKRKRKDNAPQQTQQQPGKSLPMTAALSSLSLATLGSSTSLGMDLHAISRNQRRRHNRSRRRDRSTPSPMGASTASFGSMDSGASSRTSGSSYVQRNGRHHAHHHHHQHSPSCPHAQHHHQPSPTTTTTTSTSTSTTATATTIPTIPAALTRIGYSPNPYTFLTNGARAVRAFARPWPVAVVGRAVDVRFEIGKGVFRMVVWVGSEDRAPSATSSGVYNGGEEGQGLEEGGGGGEERRMPTEVFLPLVHYAHPRLLEGGASASAKEKEVLGAGERGKGGYPPTASMASLVGNVDVRGGGGAGGDAGGDRGRGPSMESSIATLAPTPVLPPVQVDLMKLKGVEGEGEGESPGGGAVPMSAAPTLVNMPLPANVSAPMPTPPTASCTASTASTSTAVTTSSASATPKSAASPNARTPPTVAATNPFSTSTPAPLLISNTTLPSDPLIDVEVTVSGGRYAVRGQSVLWWYDVPREGEPRREYVMEVRRRGGVMKAPPTKTKAKAGASTAGSRNGSKEDFREKRRRGEKEERGCWESLCDEGGLLGGCVIA